jgi:hypothetical protein
VTDRGGAQAIVERQDPGCAGVMGGEQHTAVGQLQSGVGSQARESDWRVGAERDLATPSSRTAACAAVS